MKKLIYVAVCLAALMACSKKQGLVQVTEQTNGSETVLATANDFVAVGATKTDITQSGSDAPEFAWKTGDVIGIIPMNNETIQSNYKVSEIGSNPKQATFDGGVWALKEGKEYAAYYPFKKEALVSNESIEFSFLGQTQSANNSLEHLGAYDYMYASTVVPQSGNAQFDFEHKISLVRLQLTVPTADTYTKVVLESSASWFASGASLKLSDGTMTATETVKYTTINLNNIEVSDNGIIALWFAMLPTNALIGETLSVKLFGNENTYTGEITGFSTLTAGNAYSYAVTLSCALEVEYVDLGLPSGLKWATCNIGAKNPEEYGDYYAWGETETKSYYSSNTYKFHKSETVTEGDFAKEYSGWTKYVRKSQADEYGFRGFFDDKTVLEPEDDVAHVKFGDKWRMPTKEEFTELINSCQSEWITHKGVKGRKFTSKIAGYTDKWIFLPATGSREDGRLDNVGSYSQYWSSSLGDRAGASLFGINQNNEPSVGSGGRWIGRAVRPVSD